MPPAFPRFPMFSGSGDIQGEFTPHSLQVIDYSQKPIWIKITDWDTGTNRYAWELLDLNDPPLFDTTILGPFGGSGGPAEKDRPAYELNGRGLGDLAGVPLGAVVPAWVCSTY